MSKATTPASKLHDIDLDQLERTVLAVDRVTNSQNVPTQVFPQGDPKARKDKPSAPADGQGGEVVQLPAPAAKTALETKLLRFPADRELRKWLQNQAQNEDACVQYIVLMALKKRGAPVHPALLRKDGRRDR